MNHSSRTSQRGFSLVELMVVVAIIGILASIAIPSVNRYMAKARQSEAKTNLSALYTAEKSFFAEFNIYSGYFGVVGYNPEGQLRYKAGFSNAGPDLGGLQSAGWNQTALPTGAGSAIETETYCGASGGKCKQLADGLGQVVPGTGVSAAGDSFIAGAAGAIRKGASQVDEWTINDTKNLQNIKDGTQ